MTYEDEATAILASLTAEQSEAIDDLIIGGRRLNAIVLLREWLPGAALYACQDLIARRRAEVNAAGRLPPPPPRPTLSRLLEKVAAIGPDPRAIEACWDGDTQGWFVDLWAIVEGPSPDRPFTEVHLAAFRHQAGDMRLFNGQVPPWPEATDAAELGAALAAELSVPFHFASPESPDDTDPRWWDLQR